MIDYLLVTSGYRAHHSREILVVEWNISHLLAVVMRDEIDSRQLIVWCGSVGICIDFHGELWQELGHRLLLLTHVEDPLHSVLVWWRCYFLDLVRVKQLYWKLVRIVVFAGRLR